jgi:hypothetical protein
VNFVRVLALLIFFFIISSRVLTTIQFMTHQPFFLVLGHPRARSVDVDTIIESIFSTTGDARLPQPVPLSQMIDLLVDFWEVRL